MTEIKSHVLKAVCYLSILSTITGLLTGCWDSTEIDKLFIVTAVSLDASESPGEVDYCAQIANIPKEQESEAGGGSEGTSIVLCATGKLPGAAIIKINRDSNHRMIFSHNRVRMFGSELAEKGIEGYIDVFLRDQQARPEVPLIVVEGRADSIINANVPQEEISGLFVSGMLEGLAETSKYYDVRLIDFANRLLEKSTAPLLPLIELVEEDEKQEVKLKGMAVFKEGKMIGSLDIDETSGYIWSMGDLQKCNLELYRDEKKVIFNIMDLSTERTITLTDDETVKVNLFVEATLSTDEIMGFKDIDPYDLMEALEGSAKEEIEKKIRNTYKTAKDMKADIFAIGTSIYKKTPKKWEKIKSKWDEIFPLLELEIDVKAKILGTGQIVQSLEMEESSNENR